MSPSKLVRRAAAAFLSLSAIAVAAVFLALGAIAVAPAALASDVRSGLPPAWYAVNPGLRPMTLMHMMDKDKTGTISKEEFLSFHEELFDKLDTDHDGQISAAEWMGRSASLAKGSSAAR